MTIYDLYVFSFCIKWIVNNVEETQEMHRNAAAQQSQAVHRGSCILKEKVAACLLGLAQSQPWATQLTLADVVPAVPTTKTHMVETNACFLRGISKKSRNTCMVSLLGKTKVLLRVPYSKKHSYEACCGTDIRCWYSGLLSSCVSREGNRSVQRRCGAAPISSGHGKTSQQLSHLMMVLGSS